MDVLTVREITEDRNISVRSCHEILVEKPRCRKICPSIDVVTSERQSRHHLLRFVRSRK